VDAVKGLDGKGLIKEKRKMKEEKGEWGTRLSFVFLFSFLALFFSYLFNEQREGSRAYSSSFFFRLYRF